MLSSRTALLRARPLIAVARWSPRVLRLTNGGSSSQPTLILPTRSFSVSHYHQANETNEKHSSNVSIHDRTYLVAATTTREDIYVKPGTEFHYIKVPHHLIPQGWTNDPHELEECLALKLHEDYTFFQSSCTPILLYTGHDKWWAYLVKAGMETYVYTCFSQLFRLKTPVELTRILECMREPNGSVMFSEGEMPEDSKFLKHPELDWYQVGEDEWKEVKKAPAPYNTMYEDEFRRRMNERAMEKAKAGKEHDTLVAEAQAAGRM